MEKETTKYSSPSNIEGFDDLMQLARDVSWSWDRLTDNIWREIDEEIWEISHNPSALLTTVSKEKIKKVLANPVHRKTIEDLLTLQRGLTDNETWFAKEHKSDPLKCIAYFCMEFMLSEALPIYSGGLGNVAGDQLKAANDLGAPVVAIGLLWQQGYFRQTIDHEGVQEAFYPYSDPWQLPVKPLRTVDGEWVRLKLALPSLPVWFRVWEVQVGKRKLYLLDTNDLANTPPYRGITNELYGGTTRHRLLQELVLGMGGWQLLCHLGIEPEVCHLNEGHAAFAVFARAKTYMEKTGLKFAEALAVTRAGNLFTTHTAVAAGFDLFDPYLISQYLGDYAEKELGISHHDLFALGRQNPENSNEKFNMAYLAIRGSGSVSAVSRLHAQVSQELFSSLFVRWPTPEVPVKYVTNGIHTPTWDSSASQELWDKTCGEKRWFGTIEDIEKKIQSIPDKELWNFRCESRKTLIQFARKRQVEQQSMCGLTAAKLEEYQNLFRPDVLTIGFARRFATYKRPDLLLHNKDRLISLLSNTQRPIQLIIAGKAHPLDQPGQAIIKEWIQFIRRPEVCKHIIFISDYDILVTQNLVQGVDVWLNTPRRPWEACGTSGMKVLVNGGINLSELDGWWAEAYTPEVGWALGDGKQHSDVGAQDAKEADDLYDLLEHVVIPEFYNRGKDNIPTTWVKRMRESMARLTGPFSANRAVREYVDKHYVPAAKKYLERSADKGKMGTQLVNWRQSLDKNWSKLHFGELKVTDKGAEFFFEVQVYCNDLNPDDIAVEVYANAVATWEGIRFKMTRGKPQNVQGCYLYTVNIPKTRRPEDFTVRVIPFHPLASVPLEATHIVWQK